MARPKKDIDAKQVYKLVQMGSKITEIADFFEVSHDTIERRFASILRKGQALRKMKIRQYQMQAAARGNATILVWLGKQYLGQSDTTLDDHVLEAIEGANLSKEDLLDLIKNKDRIEAGKPKRSFHEFCKVADYPPPFDKQCEMREFAMELQETRLLLGARGYGKTDYTVILGIAYDLYLNPSRTNLIMTKSKERNTAMLGEIQVACEKNGMTFEKANSLCLRLKGHLGKDHSVSAVTVKTTSLRGRHPYRVIMDDPVTEDDTSEATRLVVQKKYNEIQKLTSNVLLIGQPAHQYDLYADIRGVVKTMEVPHGTIPELDHDLEAQRLAGVDEASISASYHLKVLSEGVSPFNAVNYLERGQFPGGTAVAFIDPSEGGDYTALSIVKAYMGGVAVFGTVWKRAWNHCLDDMGPIFKKYGVAKLAFETNCTGNMPIDLLRTTFKDIGVVGRRANNNKHSRIMAAGAFAHLIHLSKDSTKLYLDHVVKYEYKAKYDDAPDSLASCLEWVGLIRGKM